MKAFWNDSGRGPESNEAKEVNPEEATLIWSDQVRGVQGNFLGLIDDKGNTIQFYFDSSIPSHVDNASYLKIVSLDFPHPEMKGSYTAKVTIGEVHDLIVKAFKVGAVHQAFTDVTFEPW